MIDGVDLLAARDSYILNYCIKRDTKSLIDMLLIG